LTTCPFITETHKKPYFLLLLDVVPQPTTTPPFQLS
jgi:hypothetical protein